MIQEVPLGMPPESLTADVGLARALKIARPSRPMIDAIVFRPDNLLLIEFKISRWLDGLAHLVVYREMVQFTPELEQYKPLPIVLRLVQPYQNENMFLVASYLHVEVEVFSTPEIDEYINVTLPGYSQSAHKKKRAELKKNRSALGLE